MHGLARLNSVQPRCRPQCVRGTYLTTFLARGGTCPRPGDPEMLFRGALLLLFWLKQSEYLFVLT